MKKIICPLLFVLISHASFAQDLPDYDAIVLEKAADYPAADAAALSAATYLFSTPFRKNDLARLKSLQFLIKWMTGTPDYSFTLDEVASKIIKGNDDLLGLYMAAMTKYSLENKPSSKDPKLVKLNSITILLNYCEYKDNNMGMTKQLKKLSEAKAKGELEKAL
jgi:hypothetical protein